MLYNTLITLPHPILVMTKIGHDNQSTHLEKTNKNFNQQNDKDNGPFSWLFTGNATSRILDFLITYEDFDYSETDIAEHANVSLKTIYRDIPKLELIGFIENTRNVGRAKMYRINKHSKIAIALKNTAYEITSRQIDEICDQSEDKENVSNTIKMKQKIFEKSILNK